jgi:hypothetical protein
MQWQQGRPPYSEVYRQNQVESGKQKQSWRKTEEVKGEVSRGREGPEVD